MVERNTPRHSLLARHAIHVIPHHPRLLGLHLA